MLFFEIFVNKPLQRKHIGSRVENLGIVCFFTIGVILPLVKIGIKPLANRAVGAEAVWLTHGTFASYCTVGHKGGYIARKGVGVEAVALLS